MSQRIAKIAITPQLLVDLLSGGCKLDPECGEIEYTDTGDVPLDLKIIGAQWDYAYDQIVLVVESQSFSEVPSTGCVPDLPIHLVRYSRHRVRVIRN